MKTKIVGKYSVKFSIHYMHTQSTISQSIKGIRKRKAKMLLGLTQVPKSLVET